MSFRRILTLLLLVCAGFVNACTANAAMFSRDNPYRGYNISGVNYASMEWERSHKRKSSSSSSRYRNNGWNVRRDSDNSSRQDTPAR